MPALTLAKLREGLHVSASALKTFLTCPWKFKLHYVEGQKPEFQPSSLILGRAIHEAIAAHHETLRDGRESPLEELQELLETVLAAESEGKVPIRYRDGEEFETLRQVGRGLLEVYHREARPKRIVAVERAFQAQITDPRTGEVLEPRLVGVSDLVEADEEDTVSVVEVKTAARRWSGSQVDLDLQGSLYTEAVTQSGLVPDGQEVLIRYEILVKNKTPVLDTQYAVRRPGDREKALEITCDVLRAVEKGAFYRNPSWACSGCQYRGVCGL